MPQRNTEARREMLAERRERQRSRYAGFTPMPNKRINAAMQERFAALLAEDIQMRADTGIGGSPDIEQLQHDTAVQIARTLPPAPMVKSHRRRPSKSDSPAYRGIGGAGPVRQKALGL